MYYLQKGALVYKPSEIKHQSKAPVTEWTSFKVKIMSSDNLLAEKAIRGGNT